MRNTNFPGNPTKKNRRYARHREKPFEWLDVPDKHVRGEKALWVAVITQAMMDALSKSPNPEAAYHRTEAVHWLTGNSRDFVTVCLLAGLDPSYVRMKAKRALVSPVAWRAEPGKGKRYQERKAYRAERKASRKAAAPPEPVMEAQLLSGPWAMA